ncbi:coniferyl aldehyde dehydrogenase [Kangiella sediminilitoris]|uniref:Aldehyde dehydrogenase n=1 Tax=Kangiella sediminilitoris TaxID=1144748 RepID=A0A1B3B8H2_9GAMM|nr:coniferyl aldehyde dehydrogenase [Kangiella sediminilitoris]AOE49099.1 Aldehyde dehydrogenase [Kangiella sediminilitoris]
MGIQAYLEHLQQQYKLEPYPDLKRRLKLLDSLRAMLTENESAITEAVCKDFGYRSPFETELAEIYPSLKAISHTKKQLSGWMESEKRGVSLWFKPARARIMYQPVGVVGIIVPWNYPLYLALGPLVSALAAGNRVMLKVSEFTPQFSLLFTRLCEQYLGPDWVKVVYGGPDVGAEFSGLAFDHLLFTGSGEIGKKVMKAASDNLTPVTLELGGKSPTIIDKSFPIKTATERLLFGKLLNGGQTCLAPDYAFISNEDIDQFIEKAKKVAKKFYPEWENKGYTSLASNKQVERYQYMLADAKAKGATIIPLWEADGASESHIKNGKATPLLIMDTTEDMQVRQQEIFGPMLPVVPYGDHQDVIRYINSQPRPLALYLFSNKQSVIKNYMLNTISGGVTLNDTILHVSQEELPFGGIGASGMGQYHGVEGFKTFSKAKSIFKQSRFAGTNLMYPPANKLSRLLLKLMKR